MSQQPPKALEAEWYQRLAREGFQDIENTQHPDRPLERYHSFDFCRERNHARTERNADYQNKIEQFFQEHIHDVSALIVGHGNSKIAPRDVQNIVQMHCDGFTERQIAVSLQRSKTCIHKVIVKVRAWMKLV